MWEVICRRLVPGFRQQVQWSDEHGKCHKYHQHFGDGADAEHVHGDSYLHGRACKATYCVSAYLSKTKSSEDVPMACPPPPAPNRVLFSSHLDSLFSGTELIQARPECSVDERDHDGRAGERQALSLARALGWTSGRDRERCGQKGRRDKRQRERDRVSMWYSKRQVTQSITRAWRDI